MQDITLEKLKLTDVDDFLEIVNDKQVLRFYRFAYARNIPQALKILKVFTDPKRCLSYKVLNKDNICVGIVTCELNKDTLGISYIIGKKHRNQRYATSTLQELFKTLRNLNKFKQVFFIVDVKNTYSEKLLKNFNCNREDVKWNGTKYYLYDKCIP